MTGKSESDRRDRRAAGQQNEARDTSKESESGNFSDPRIQWPNQEWRRTEQAGGELPHSRATGDPGARSAPDNDTLPPGRPDEVIREDVREALDADSACDATQIEIQVRAGAVVLEGRVPTRPMKHRAAEIAGGAADARTVDNRLQVG